MIACYAWSNMMLINIVNLKINVFRDQEADIFVRIAPGISTSLIASIRSSGLFKNVFFVEVPRINRKAVLLGAIPKLRSMFYYRAYRKHYNRILFNLVQETEYSTILLPGFWNDGLYYIDYFARYNRAIKIFLFDEGGMSYDNGKRELTKYYAHSMDIKQRIARFFPEKFLSLKFKKNVENCIYLYAPQRYMADKILKPRQIPIINNSNPCLDVLIDSVSNLDHSHFVRYNKISAIFIAGYIYNGYEKNYNQSYSIIEAIIQSIGGKNLVVKPHINSTINKETFAKDFEKRTYVDRNTYLLEGLYTHIDLDNKILISRGSTAAMYPKYMLGKEPFVIITYRLYQKYHQFGDDNAERYAADLKEAYYDKSKVMVPNSMEEFREMLLDAYTRTLPYAVD